MQNIEQKDLFFQAGNEELKQVDESTIIAHPEHHVNILSKMATDKLQNNIDKAIIYYDNLVKKAAELTYIFYQNEDICQRAAKVVKTGSIGLMQVQNVKKLLDGQTLLIEQTVNQYNIICTQQQLNHYTTNLILDYLNNLILKKILELLEKFPNLEKQEKRNLTIYIAKLQSCIEIFPGATVVLENDIFSLNQDHPNWQSLYRYIEKKQLNTDEKIKQSYDKVCEGILLGNAIISKGSEQKFDFSKSVMQGFGAVYYSLNKKKMKSRASHFLAEAKKEDAFRAWNLPETGIIKSVLPILFPSIEFCKKIYIPRLFRAVSANYVLDQYKRGLINKINNDIGLFGPESQLKIEELLNKDLDPNRVQVRVLCHENLDMNQKSIFRSMMIKKKPKVFDKIIIHIHGGGFVAMSSRSHQTYTRKWAKNLKVPIFSIDYRVAPENPYPAGLDDCWQAYMFILYFVTQYFNIAPNKVVLVGDSAGGNLVAALTIQAIKAGVRVPDGILLAYPALSLDMKTFTPSFLVSLDDSLLHHTVLKLCLDSYIKKEFDGCLDPMLSPSKASDEILSRFPKTRIQVGTYDPLHDESFRLLQRLVNLKKDVRLIEYQSMPHGFLSFDIPNGMKEAKQTVIDAENLLSEMLNS